MTLKHPVRYIGKAGYEFLLSLFMSLVLKALKKLRFQFVDILRIIQLKVRIIIFI